MWKTRWILVLAGLWLFGLESAAAPWSTNFSVKVWNTEEGLPQSSVIALTQSRDGYLWLGTVNGLARFDGTRFTTFDEANTPGLSSSPIVKLFEDSRGRLWVATESAGVMLVDKGVVTTLNIGGGSREGRVASIAEDADGAVWLYTANGQLWRHFRGQIDNWDAAAGLPSRTRSVAVDKDCYLWIGVDWLLEGRGPLNSANSTGLPPVAFGMPAARLDYVLASASGGYWRIANGRIEKRIKDRSLPEHDLGLYPWRFGTPVYAACEDKQGNLVVGTGGEGLFWFLPGREPVRISQQSGGLSHNTVLSLCCDREGNIWVGTDSGGLNRVKHQVFSVLPTSAGQVVKSVAEDRKGGVWIACNWEGGGVNIENYGPAGTRSYTNVHGLLNDVRTVYQDRNEQVWAGTFGGGLLRLQNQLWLTAPGAGVIPRDREIPAIFEDSRSRLWVGFSGGLIMREGERCRVFGSQEGLSPGTVRALAEDKEGNLWVGTENGLNRFQSDAFTRYGKTNGLPSDSISSLLVDPDGVLWVGTQSGLARMESGRWISFGNAFGQALGNVAYLLEDGLGDLWIGSNTGLLRAKRSALNDFAKGETEIVPFRSFGAADGLPTRECSQGSQPSACRTEDGTLWFATVRGLAYVHPSQLVINTNPPPVIIESIAVDGVLQQSKTLRSPIPESLVIPAGKESLEIRYTALNLSAPDRSRFRYQLEGHETKWTEVSGEVRVAHYSKLPPKEYRFRVLAANEDNVWNEVGSTLVIRVLPPFWRTWWFLTAVALGLLGMIIGSVHYVSTQKLQRQLALMRQQEVLEKERARIARDLHDQLGANLTQVALLGEMAEDDRELPDEVAAHAQQICQTARDTTRALDEIVWTVNPSNDTLDGLLNYVCKYAQEYLALAGLKYRLETPKELPATPISPELRHNVFLAAKEAVNNVVKHSGADSAWLRLKVSPDRFVLEIEDNGKGLTAADQNKGRNGLRNMRKRMEDVGGEFEFAVGENGGTRITLKAPIQRQPAAEA